MKKPLEGEDESVAVTGCAQAAAAVACHALEEGRSQEAAQVEALLEQALACDGQVAVDKN